MNKNDYKQSAYYLFYLIRCVLKNKIPTLDKIEKMNLSQIYSVAKAHSLTAIAAYALESAGITDERFRQAKGKSMRKNATMDIERERIFAEFEKSGIWYMPLKGIILQCLYPEYGMRQMCDNDILYDKAYSNELRKIMSELGYTTPKIHTGHDIIFHKEPVCNFEMHYALFSESKDNCFCDYYSNIKRLLHKVDGKEYEYSFSDEDFYIYITAHEYKHFSKGGTGLRSLVDTYVLVKYYYDKLDKAYINNELSKLGIAEYEFKQRNLALKLFDGIQLSIEEKELLDYYIFSGTYGTIENSVNNSADDSLYSKVKYLRKRLFLPMLQIKNVYPFFYKYKIFIPILYLYRIGLMLTKSRKRVISEIKTLLKI
ncbi:MAG: nucleotidyltransferase family protein [Ruminococcus sp.]|nr:nucleotidyltransferase family protein [Ruminococcus sp.]